MSRPSTETPSAKAIASKPLNKATCQELQLELIRRRRFNGFDGERVVSILLAHRELWEAVVMDRLARIFRQNDWCGAVDVHADHDDVDNALGGARPGQAIVSIWWE
jgi:hypothetical protein